MIYNGPIKPIKPIKDTIDRNKDFNAFASDMSFGQSQMTKLKREDGSLKSTNAEVLPVIEEFYGRVYIRPGH